MAGSITVSYGSDSVAFTDFSGDDLPSTVLGQANLEFSQIGLGYSTGNTIFRLGDPQDILYLNVNDNGSVISVAITTIEFQGLGGPGGTGGLGGPGGTGGVGGTGGSGETPIIVVPISTQQEYSSLPEFVIDSNTGEGATIYPVLKFTPKVNVIPQISINDKGVLKIVDCV